MVTKLWLVQEFLKKINQRGITWKLRKGEQLLLCLTHRLDLIHIPKWLPSYGGIKSIPLELNEYYNQPVNLAFTVHIQNLGQCLSSDPRFPTMWFVRPAKPQISLRICNE